VRRGVKDKHKAQVAWQPDDHHSSVICIEVLLQQGFGRLLRLLHAAKISGEAVEAIAGRIPQSCATHPETEHLEAQPD
jgi:hypothetical protein